MIMEEEERCWAEKPRRQLKIYPDLLLVAERHDRDVRTAVMIDDDAICTGVPYPKCSASSTCEQPKVQVLCSNQRRSS